MSPAPKTRHRSLSARLRAAFLTLGLVAIGLTGWQSYRIADRALEDAAYARLTAIRETKKRQIEAYFRTVARTVETLANGEVAADATLGFEAAGGDPDGSDRRAVEELHGETLESYTAAFGFDELLLIGATPRRILYSTRKGIPPGALSDSGGGDRHLARLVEATLASASDHATIADFSQAPMPNAIAAPLAAAAIRDGGRVIGVLAVRLSTREIDQVMTGGSAWKQEGLGDTGETYLVGGDGLMRSDSRFYLENPRGYVDQVREESLAGVSVERLEAAGSTVMSQEVRTEAVRRAFAGEAETSRVIDYRGLNVLSSFTPLDLPGLNWVLLSEIDEDEVFRPIRVLRNRLLVTALGVSAAYLAIGFWFSRRTTRPLHALAAEIDEMRRKGLEARGSLSSFRNADDEIARLAASFHDLAERLRATTVSRDYLDNVLGSMLNSVFVVSEGQGGPMLSSANQAARRLLGLEERDVTGQPLGAILGSGLARPEWLVRLRKDGSLPPIETTLVDADGRHIPVLFTAALVSPADGAPSDVVCVAQDITPLKRAEDQLRVLARRLISAQEEERSRLARELHDDITQRLGLLAIDAGKLEGSSSLPQSARTQATGLKERSIQLSEDVQRLSHSLHPTILQDLGLVAALRADCTALAKRLDLPVSLAAEDPPEALPPEARLALYRIAQECFHNIARHAGASEVNVELSSWENRVCLVVEDDGCGFAPSEERGRGGLGLASMEERARLAGGSFHVESSPGHGARIVVEVPVGTDSI